MAATIYTTAQVADKLETDARTLRRFLRADGRGVGKGSRHSITGRDLAPLKSRFNKWVASEAQAKADRAAAKAETKATEGEATAA